MYLDIQGRDSVTAQKQADAKPAPQLDTKFYRADIQMLQASIDSTGKSKSEISASGKLNADTLNKALKGLSVTRTKANGIVNGLNVCGASPRAIREILFPHSE